MDFIVKLLDGEITGYVVNSPGTESAKPVAERAIKTVYDHTDYTIEPCEPKHVPSMFQNCYMDVTTINSLS